MKINWKRVVIAAIWSELVLTVIYIAVRYAISAGLSSDFGISIITLDWFGLMFLGRAMGHAQDRVPIRPAWIAGWDCRKHSVFSSVSAYWFAPAGSSTGRHQIPASYG